MIRCTLAATLFCVSLIPCGAVEKLKPEELIAKHLDSIGNAEARGRYRTWIANGTVTMGGVVGSGAGEMTGKLTFLSDGGKVRVGMEFPSKSFPGDHYAFDGSKVTISYLQPGVRSIVGSFIDQNPYLVSEGILSGALTTNWALLHVEARKPKLSYKGLKKVGERRLHALGYKPRKGADEVEISLLFDPETFRHVRTEMRYEQRNMIASDAAASARQSDTTLLVSEDYESFQTIEGLNLPTICRIEANLTGARTLVYRWLLTFNEWFLNKPLEDRYFRVQ